MNTITDFRNSAQIQEVGLDALVNTLGTVGAVRFLQIFSHGTGDCVNEKYSGEEPSIDEIVENIYKKRCVV